MTRNEKIQSDTWEFRARRYDPFPIIVHSCAWRLPVDHRPRMLLDPRRLVGGVLVLGDPRPVDVGHGVVDHPGGLHVVKVGEVNEL